MNNLTKKQKIIFSAIAAVLVIGMILMIIFLSKSQNQIEVNPTPTVTIEVTSINIIKHPTAESKNIGDSVMFIAEADKYDTVEWFCKNSSGAVIEANNLPSYFSGVGVDGAHTQVLTISNVQEALDGCSFYATFKNSTTEVSTSSASLTILRDIVITHNPTSETRSLGTDWYWDSTNKCARNDNVTLCYKVEALNATSIQWYICLTSPVPAQNFPGVTGANSTLLCIPARSDLNSAIVYAVLSNNYGKTAQTTNATYTVTYSEKTASHYVFLTDTGVGGYVSNYTPNGNNGASMSITLTSTDSQATYTVSVVGKSGTVIPVANNGVNFYYTMPDEDVYITVVWSIPQVVVQ